MKQADGNEVEPSRETAQAATGSYPILDPAQWVRAGLALLIAAVVLAMYPTTGDSTGPIKTILLSWGVCALAAFYGVATTAQGISWRKPGLLLGALIALVLLALSAALASNHTGFALVEVRRLAALALAACLAGQVYRTRVQCDAFLATVCCAAAVNSLYALGQYAGADPFPWAYEHGVLYAQLPGTLGNPNYAAHLVALAAVLSIYLSTTERWRWCIVFAPLFLVHLRFTGQRGGVAALAIALLVAGIAIAIKHTRRKTAITMKRLFAGAGCLCLAGILLAAGGSYAKYGRLYPLDSSLLERYNGYVSAASMAAKRPLLGFGPGSFVIENPPFWTAYEQLRFALSRETNARVHNDILEWAVDAGIPAAGLYVLFLSLIAATGLWLYFRDTGPRGRLGLCFAVFAITFTVDGCFGFNFRLPASALLLVVVSGQAAAAITSENALFPARLRGMRWAFLAAILAVITAIAVGDARVFLSQLAYTRAASNVRLGRYRDAGEALAKAEQLAPWKWNYSSERGSLQLDHGNLQTAAVHFTKALEKNPNSLMALANLAKALMEQALAGQGPLDASQAQALDASAQAIQRALSLCPVLPAALELQGRIEYALTQRTLPPGIQPPSGVTPQPEAAEKHLRQAVQYGVEKPAPLYLLIAQIRQNDGDIAGAAHDAARAAAVDPASNPAWEYWFSIASQANAIDAFEQALQAEWEKASRKQPPQETLLAVTAYWQGRAAQAFQQDTALAESWYVKAQHYAPYWPVAWMPSTELADASGRRDALREQLRKALSAIRGTPPMPPAMEAVRIVFEDKETAEAAAILRAELPASSAPRDQSQLEQLAWAAQWVEESLTDHSAEPAKGGAAYVNLGLVYAAAGQMERADACLGRAALFLAQTDPAQALPGGEDTARRIEACAAACPSQPEWAYLAERFRVETK